MLPHYARAEGGRAVPRARRAGAGPHRPRRRPRAGRRHAHRDGAEPERARTRPSTFPQQVARPAGLGRAASRHRGIVAHPRPPDGAGVERTPEVWVLGSSDYGAQLAAHLGLPYAFAYFFTDGQGVEAGAGPVPQPLPAERAPPAAAGHDLRLGAGGRRRRRRPRYHALQPRALARSTASAACSARCRGPTTSRCSGFEPADAGARSTPMPRRRRLRRQRPRRSPRSCARWRPSCALDELVVNTWAHDQAVRRRSYALLAQEFGLGGASAA
ncbi:MAG: hypothetical protein MZW92_22500 [Comamonadaceae bacterium]|nr:hypothetical protein [Comamonadaceae bacterium]